ncbi:MAG: NADH-quinone oxidoreductase subunit N [Ardenticatenaceae bacterium]|nr:NADH-quinone oxidoreductase subunit N [Ardenticatenaceae bacterium]MCB9445328.1 NADH-quinone oxidoreductase subunit N [Ardenticatenaceae bacterium]
MNTTELTALLPMIVVAATAVFLLLVIAFYRQHQVAAGITAVGITASLAALWPAWNAVPQAVTPLLVVDRYGLLLMGLLLFTGLVVTLLAASYWSQRGGQREEFYLLLLLATLGTAVLTVSAHFAGFFLGLELLSVSLYGLIAYPRQTDSIQAGVKYLVLAAVSAAFMLFGMALVYADRGTMFLEQLAAAPGSGLLWSAGLALLLVGIGFKLAIVPFHMWIGDVYAGAPAPAAAFVATASKTAVFAVLLRFFLALHGPQMPSLAVAMTITAVLSMLGGSILVLVQRNVKRLLAYSSIAHIGYALVAFLAGGTGAAVAVAFYLAAYSVTTLVAFGVLMRLSSLAGNGDTDTDADMLDDYQGLFWRQPGLAVMLTAALFSLAGIPLTAGFVGKFMLLTTGVRAQEWLLAITLAVSSGVSLFAYLHWVVVMFRAAPEGMMVVRVKRPLSTTVLATLLLLLLWLGVYPAPLLSLLQNSF